MDKKPIPDLGISETKMPVPDYADGVCPLMTSTQAVPVAMGANISAPNGQPQIGMEQIVNFVPCLTDKCQLWQSGHSQCSICEMGIIAYHLENLINLKSASPRGKNGG